MEATKADDWEDLSLGAVLALIMVSGSAGLAVDCLPSSTLSAYVPSFIVSHFGNCQ